ncbi:hypothetical protein NP493_1487g00003 [Ridgeia piscesae]|uniref:Uncharacterized protein n=1 Tax=Ridgeia piscesae TaxID=27915 RepID=A0AAD9K2A8_RIDPI|nr:hypothetical protein NP493_1487g00003 [Ridgeia piscesae]
MSTPLSICCDIGSLSSRRSATCPPRCCDVRPPLPAIPRQLAERDVEEATSEVTPGMYDGAWQSTPWADPAGFTHSTQSGWSRVVHCLNCAVNSEILARLAPSDHQLPSLVDENQLCGWNPEDSECLRHACAGDCFREDPDSTHDKVGSPPPTKPKRNRRRRLPPSSREQKGYPFHHHKDLHVCSLTLESYPFHHHKDLHVCSLTLESYPFHHHKDLHVCSLKLESYPFHHHKDLYVCSLKLESYPFHHHKDLHVCSLKLESN